MDILNLGIVLATMEHPYERTVIKLRVEKKNSLEYIFSQ